MAKCYILETPANWFFRRKVPADLRDKIGRREIKVSLKTGSKQEAIKLARALVVKTDLLFSTLRGKSMASDRIDIPGLTEMIVESTVTHANGSSLHRKIEMSQEELIALLHARSASPEIAGELLKQLENIMQSPGADQLPAVVQPQLVAPVHQANACDDVPSMKLSDAIREYIEFGVEMDRWKNEKIRSEAEADLNLLIEVLGDRPLNTITSKMALDFRRTLTKIPTRRKTRPMYTGRTIEDLRSDKTIPKEDLYENSSINGILSSCSGLFTWAFKGAFNPFSDLKKKERGAKHAKRDSFNDEELLLIFSHETFTGSKPNKVYQYWSPLIALLTGMRQTEIAQLCLADIRERDGVYGISIHEDEPGHTVKTENSRRFVPIHKELLRLGFKERVERLLAQGEKRLFPELYLWEKDPNRQKPGEKVYVGQTISKWFNGKDRFLSKLGINDPLLVFHSFRKNFITAMALNDAQEEDRTAIVGHEDGKTHKRYITKFNYPKLKEIVDAVDFSEALVNVMPWNMDWR